MSIHAVESGYMNMQVDLFAISNFSPDQLDRQQPDNFVLITLIFDTKNHGASLLRLDINALGDARGDALTAQAENGMVQVSDALEAITFEGFEAGARISGVFASRGSGPIYVEATNPRLRTGTNAAVVFDSSCPPSGLPRDCSGNDADLGTPNQEFGGPGRGVGGARSNDTALGKLLIVAENLADEDEDRLVDEAR